MYIGSVTKNSIELWVYNGDKMEKKNVDIASGLYKIFDEILVNASDHHIRLKCENVNDQVTQIKVNIDQENNEISIYNNGEGVPIQMHPEHNIYIPELIFGNLLSSGNYNDDEKKIVGGTNGIGSKATNIYSSKFIVETVDAVTKKKYIQEFSNNMFDKQPPKITKCSTKPYTKITFQPDLKKFGMNKLDDDIVSLMTKRVYDLTAITHSTVNVYFNDKRIECKTFEKYVDLYLGAKNEKERIYEKVNDRWEIIVATSEDEEFEHVSFVNGIYTYKGGKHVDYVSTHIANKLSKYLANRGRNKLHIKPEYIKKNMFLFLHCYIENPSFSSQTKEELTTASKDFGSKCIVSDKFIEKLSKTDIVERSLALGQHKNDLNLASKTENKKQKSIRVPKLDDAIWAGTNKSQECTLILCEGDSAKATAIAGLSVVGREKFGVFPLKGKPINVRDLKPKKNETMEDVILKNEEVKNIIKIMGLQLYEFTVSDNGKKSSAKKTRKIYKDTSELRYGKIMLFSDQDSVAGDTPLLLKKNEKIYIETIERINSEWNEHTNGKEYGKSNCEIWTENGWTKINKVIRHKVSKKMYRVLTHTGIVDVTEDHSLLLDDKTEIAPKNCKIEDKLLHSYPLFNNCKVDIPDDLEDLTVKDLQKIARKIKMKRILYHKKQELIEKLKDYKNHCTIELNEYIDINEDEAFVMGLFWADGTSGIYKWKYMYKNKNRPCAYTYNRTSYNWAISNNDLELLEKTKGILESIYDYEFKILKVNNKNGVNQSYKLMMNGCSKTKDIVEKYTNLFYYKNQHPKYKNGNKYIPSCILNASTNIREKFLEGLYAGDGNGHNIYDKKASLTVDIESKISAQCVFFLCKSLGYEVSINYNPKKSNIYSLMLTKGTQQWHPHKIKKIIELPNEEQYVYDLETENHHFQAGIGQMIVHNTDGFHIKGLLLNMINSLWPELSEVKDFITSLPTPIVKVSKGKQVIPFYSLTDFEKWKESTNTKGWSHKYYKGLGTSTAQEGKEYFRSYEKELVKYNQKDEGCIAALKMAFEGGKDRANERKEWLSNYDMENIIEPKQKEVSYKEFINKELIHFSNYDCIRSIPSVCDGFKPVQRKIMFSSFKRNMKSDVKVAQFSGYVSEHSAYHHGEMSLQGAIIKMAQNFVGSNNINLLFPSGQFGTRNGGGDDHASPRYIFTRLEEITASIFNKLDEPLYEYLDDDGQKIEPQWYLPLIPMILVNGTKGIGTGFSTDVPCYDPLDLVKNIRRLLEEEEVEEMMPWYRGFDGEIKQIEDQKFECRGKYEIVNDTTFKITELPIGTWTQKYEEILDGLVIDSSVKDAKKKKMQCITDFDKGNGCTDTKVEFVIKMPKARLTAYKKDKDKLEKDFKLVTTINTTNMHLYNEKLQLRKYNNVEDILKEFYELRLDYYLKRKVYWLIKIKKELDIMAAKIRFIQFVREQKIDIRKPEEDIIEILEENNFPKFSNKESSLMKEEDEINEDELNYDYLLRMQIRTLTQKVMEKMMKEHEMRMAEYKELEKKSNKDLWKEDLDTFEQVYKKFMKEWTQLQMEESGTTKKKIIKKKIVKNV